jgi:hypothetical protein
MGRPVAADVGANDEGPRTAGDLAFDLVITEYQGVSPSSSKSPDRSTWLAGWMVDTACL